VVSVPPHHDSARSREEATEVVSVPPHHDSARSGEEATEVVSVRRGRSSATFGALARPLHSSTPSTNCGRVSDHSPISPMTLETRALHAAETLLVDRLPRRKPLRKPKGISVSQSQSISQSRSVSQSPATSPRSLHASPVTSQRPRVNRNSQSASPRMPFPHVPQLPTTPRTPVHAIPRELMNAKDQPSAEVSFRMPTLRRDEKSRATRYIPLTEQAKFMTPRGTKFTAPVAEHVRMLGGSAMTPAEKHALVMTNDGGVERHVIYDADPTTSPERRRFALEVRRVRELKEAPHNWIYYETNKHTPNNRECFSVETFMEVPGDFQAMMVISPQVLSMKDIRRIYERTDAKTYWTLEVMVPGRD